MLHSALTRTLLGITLFVDWAAWVVSLAGLAALTDACRKDTGDYNAFGFGNLVLTTVGSFVDAEERIYNCGIYYSLQWWIIFLQFVVVIWAALGSFVEFFHSKHVIMHMMAVASTLYCLMAYDYVRLSFMTNDDMDNKAAQAAAAMAAGCIGVLVCNFIYVMLFGMDEAPAAPAPDAGAAAMKA